MKRGGGALDQAVAWAVRLGSGQVSEADRQAFAHWHDTQPQNAQAWRQVQAVEQAFAGVPPANRRLAHDTLDKASAKSVGRRHALRVLGLGLFTAGVGVLAHRTWQLHEQAHHLSGVGERRRLALSDGTELHLNTATEVRQVYTPWRRALILKAGEILVDTGGDAASLWGARRFWVETPTARLEALGTRFSVRHDAGGLRLHVVQGRVAMHTGRVYHVAEPGESLVLKPGATVPVRWRDPGFDTTAWADGVLVARQMRLDALVAELARYRVAPLHCDAAVAGLRVSGVFQLEGADPVGRALSVLLRTLPLRLRNAPGGGHTLVAG